MERIGAYSVIERILVVCNGGDERTRLSDWVCEEERLKIALEAMNAHADEVELKKKLFNGFWLIDRNAEQDEEEDKKKEKKNGENEKSRKHKREAIDWC